jgi:SAM-dependent methyltransferase
MNCRVCGDKLELVLDLGNQALGGQFPKIGEPDPPSAPIRFCRCVGCGLAQLDNTVLPELMFKSYGYRSGVSATMREHLYKLATEACQMVGGWAREYAGSFRILDIGGNDGTLLQSIHLPHENLYLIDPSDVPVPDTYSKMPRVNGFFPRDIPDSWRDFDLIFTVACFYDADDPVGFAKAVAERLKPDGIWCVEVADARRLATEGSWDQICHEHLCYYEVETFLKTCWRAGLVFLRCEPNDCNGGSLRFYLRKGGKVSYQGLTTTASEWAAFADDAERSKCDIKHFLDMCLVDKKVVHLLGASTKANTWLQAAGVSRYWIRAASDRDPRKIGRMTPGTHIPIISEEESRKQKPDVYIVGPWYFEKEIVEREKAFLERGGRLVFPLPRLHEIKNNA